MMNLHGAILLAAAMTAPTMPQPMAMDTPVSFGNVQTVCTGVGSAKDDPQWTQYPIRIEFSNDGAQYLSGAHVTLSQGGQPVVVFFCVGFWVLMKGFVCFFFVSFFFPFFFFFFFFFVNFFFWVFLLILVLFMRFPSS